MTVDVSFLIIFINDIDNYLQKEYTAVKEDCSKALELNPKYVKALLRRARTLEELKDLEAALEDITAACLFEGFNNPSNLAMADRILDKLGELHCKNILQYKQNIILNELSKQYQ